MSDAATALDPSPAAVPADDQTLYLVDGSGYIFRAFFALPPMTRSDGISVNAVYGFTNMMIKFLGEKKARRVAVVFDASEETFRKEIYPEYKANRPPLPEDLAPQFPLIREAVTAFALPCVEQEGYEADDLIATYARIAGERGERVVIVSSDKDLMQLIRPGVEMYDPMKDKAIGPAEVFEKFGVTPDKVVDVQALCGDSTDNVPGVRGIGAKTAAELLAQFGTLENLLDRAHEIKQPKRRETLLASAEIARISKRLVTLDAHVPITTPYEALVAPPLDEGNASLIAFVQKQNFRSIETKLRGLAKPPPPASVTAKKFEAETAPETVEYRLVQDEAELDRVIAEAYACGTIGFDTETDGRLPCTAKLVGLSIATAPGRAWYIPVGHTAPGPAGELGLSAGAAPEQLPCARVVERLKPLLEDQAVMKVGHNIAFDLQVMDCLGVRVAPYDDSMLLSYVLDGGRLTGHGMDDLAQLHLKRTTITYDQVAGKGKAQVSFDRVPLDRARDYAAEDADIALSLQRHLRRRLVGERKTELYELFDRPLARVVADMESAGVLVDRDVLAELSADFKARMAVLAGEIFALAGHEFNLAAPGQVGQVLFGEMGLAGGRRTKTGQYSVDADTLERLAEEGHEIAVKISEWRSLEKLRGTYTDALQAAIQARTGRVHTNFALALTNTGRLSSSDPNLQNIPIRTEDGRKIRRAFVAAPGHVLLSCDYSQIELRLAAAIAKVEGLRRAFEEGGDIHALTASQVFGVPLDAMTPDLRRSAKAINFGILYGISNWGLARQLGITPGEAGTFIRQYKARYSELTNWMEDTKAFARTYGFVETLFGRRCVIPMINDSRPNMRAFGERQAINAPMQGTAADLMRRAMVRTHRALAQAGLRARMLLQVHDELVLEVPEDELDRAKALVVAEMEGAGAGLSVPIRADAGAGPNWAEAH